ncbi:ABC transporter substrate-binding protein [Nonomuraea roseoviolacea]|uniref:Peptide/nickel transport system substrate-binding protein n=1 Tax=Nonomuraea roseoviolacea subsp. carminata TaxID=160689 RepID=A0ABT1KDU6_9ACTN|nr:ABC transporter substrate-binding protein [Nonomuraea roseoviolacea]MCP2351139.1 peptide/nickel transport system substrate-binding protein [Nonomuraea roseoviolacea subsp. carminata]
MRASRTAAATTLLTLAVAACGGAPRGGGGGSAAFEITKDTAPAKGPVDSVTWSLYAEPQSLDYAYAFDYHPNTVLANVCEQLMRITPDLKVEPGLASAAASPDPRRWVYTIRSGVRFHDGSTLTADDVVASMRRHLDPKVGSYWVSAYKDVDRIEKTGPMEVTVHLKKPDQLFNEEMGTSAGTIESAASLARPGYGAPDTGVNCTGPYALDSWQKGQSITLRKFGGYWDPSLTPKADTIKAVFITDPAARVNALLSGEVDGGYLLPSTGFPKLRAAGNGTLYFGPNTTAVNVIPTNLKGPLGDVRVRRALSMALDREGIIKAAAGGVATPAKAPGAIGAWGIAPEAAKGYYARLPALTQDVAGAKKLIQEAGAAGKKIVMATSTLAPDIGVIANAVQSAGQAIGLRVELKAVAPEAYTALFSDPKAREGIDLVMTIWYDSTPDPLEFYGILQTGDFANYGGYSNPGYDALVAKANAQADPAARAATVAELQEIAVREMVWIPLYEVPHSLFLNKRLTGAPTGISQLVFPWAARLGSAG